MHASFRNFFHCPEDKTYLRPRKESLLAKKAVVGVTKPPVLQDIPCEGIKRRDHVHDEPCYLTVSERGAKQKVRVYRS